MQAAKSHFRSYFFPFGVVQASATARQTLNPGVTWFGWHVPAGFELVAVAVLGIVALAVAVNQFSRTE